MGCPRGSEWHEVVDVSESSPTPERRRELSPRLLGLLHDLGECVGTPTGGTEGVRTLVTAGDQARVVDHDVTHAVPQAQTALSSMISDDNVLVIGEG